MPTCSCLPEAQDSEYDLLKKLLTAVCTGGGGSGGGSIAVRDEGVLLTASVTQFNFVGGGITATAVGNSVTVTVPAGGTGDVVGPGVAVNDDIATFNGVTGKLIKDSGVAISSIITTSTIQSRSDAIGNAQTSLTVAFPVVFASVPTVVCTMSRPTGGANIAVGIDSETITAAGFRARFSAATPNGTYILQWMAKI